MTFMTAASWLSRARTCPCQPLRLYRRGRLRDLAARRMARQLCGRLLRGRGGRARRPRRARFPAAGSRDCLYGHDIDKHVAHRGRAALVDPEAPARGGRVSRRDRVTGESLTGPARKRVGLQLEGRAPAREGAAIATPDGARSARDVRRLRPHVGRPSPWAMSRRACARGRAEIASHRARQGASRQNRRAMPFVPHRYNADAAGDVSMSTPATPRITNTSASTAIPRIVGITDYAQASSATSSLSNSPPSARLSKRAGGRRRRKRQGSQRGLRAGVGRSRRGERRSRGRPRDRQRGPGGQGLVRRNCASANTARARRADGRRRLSGFLQNARLSFGAIWTGNDHALPAPLPRRSRPKCWRRSVSSISTICSPTFRRTRS